MPGLYAYEVRDKSGNALTGQMQAETPQVVAAQLRDQGYVVVRINEAAAPTAQAERRPSTTFGRISHAAFAQLYRELATLVGSGMTIIQALHVVEENTASASLRWAVRSIIPGIERGQRLSENMRRFPQAFSPLAVAIVAAGEASGKLEEMLRTLAEYAEHDLEVQRMIQRETLYPKILAGAILVIPLVVVIVVSLLGATSAGPGLLIPSAILLGLMGLTGLGVLLLRSYQQSDQGRTLVDRLRLTLWPFAGLNQKIVMSRFCRALSALYAAGVTMPEGVKLSADAAANLALAAELRGAIPHLSQGGRLSEVLATSRYVPATVVAMLRTGEQTGNIDGSLGKVAEYYDDEAKTKIRQLATAIVPICVIIGGLFVILILVSFYVGYVNSIMSASGG
ncbi:MAG: type II secretion system F family protein [Armatimonadetes bacterium]|nr:type II secretion system F family protein [Armatimonadota bacterium]